VLHAAARHFVTALGRPCKPYLVTSGTADRLVTYHDAEQREEKALAFAARGRAQSSPPAAPSGRARPRAAPDHSRGSGTLTSATSSAGVEGTSRRKRADATDAETG
jgi:hypothetical protein